METEGKKMKKKQSFGLRGNDTRLKEREIELKKGKIERKK